MEPFVYVREYKLFLDWFKYNYPRLHDKYLSHILVPRDHGGIKIIRDDLQEKTYNRLVTIRNAYYLQKAAGYECQ